VKRKKIPHSLQNSFLNKKWAFFETATRIETLVRVHLSEKDRALLFKLLMQLKPETVPYRLCQLQDYDGDISKRWYIWYWAWNPISKKLQRQREWISQKFSESERREFAYDFISQVDKMLKDGKQIIEEEPKQSELLIPTFICALDEAMTEKESKIDEPKTLISYRQKIIYLKKWAIESKNESLLVNQFEKRHASNFFTWLAKTKKEEIEKKVIKGGRKGFSNRTFNNYRTLIHSIFSELEAKDYFQKNPIAVVDERSIIEPPNTPFTPEVEDQILSYIYSIPRYRELYYICKVMYHACARETEILKLKGKNIFNNRIQFNGGLSKSRKSQYIPITDALKEVFEEMGVFSIDPNAYLFGKSGIGDFFKCPERRYGKMFDEVKKALGLISDYSMYSWKDTGACVLWIATKDLLYVMMMCRHHSPQQTMDYLRGMGMLVNENYSSVAPRLNHKAPK
jgi:site-specific recombinase XerD